ncbi:MFS transporter [Streptomyces sp. NBC_01014]|uniref:MFS transporter n=1 Tax=Streptomyces sp. NBC_01014 TaxID=2903719 RepID=UPI00386711AA|nr:MFS transporter [Streptomyces sp. NBC_01014]
MKWSIGRVLRDRNAGLYLAGAVVDAFGTSAMWLASGIWVKALTGSDSLAALAVFAMWAPSLVGPLIGTVADRVRRKPLLVVTNLGMAALMPVLLALDSPGRIWILFTVLVIYGVHTVVGGAAESALVAAAVDKDLLGDFNGLRMTVTEGMKLLSPLVGAGLFVQFGGAAVALLDAVTFALAAVIFTLIRVREAEPVRPAGAHWLRDTIEGARFLRGSPTLRPLVLAGSATMLVAGLNGSMIYAVVDRLLGHSPGYAGLLYSVQGVGSIAIGVLSGPLMRRLPPRVFAAAGIAVFAAAVGARALPYGTTALVSSAAVGFGLPCVLVAALTAVQSETPAAVLGRTAATANSLMFVPNAVALALGAGLVAVVDVRVLLAVASVSGLAVALALARTGVRTARPVRV